jgi:HlyD family secretion protein
LLLLAVALVAGAGYVVAADPLHRNQAAPVYQTATVSQGTLQVAVNATGPITNPLAVPLSFKNSGTLSEIDVSVGQAVKAGQVLAREDTSDLQNQVDQAQANLAAQQANEAKVMAGATPEQIAASQAQVNAAQTTLDGSQKSLQSTQAIATATVAGSQADVNTAQVNLVSAQKSLSDGQAQLAQTLQIDQATVDNAQLAYQDQLATFNANWGQV